ncbi:MAG TPA: LacI family DNA-binding transcriptional regulator [bacterium]|nr:LacI family DNA-binding transcriptional regulator [bacterium]HPN44096.1 LacI family DNA-binding transcriptional regulator [bacterium]
MINIKVIAELAHVSKSTVSKALNNRSDISYATRQKILEIARQHNFTPNAYGKGLKSRTTGNIGVIFYRDILPLSGNPFYSRVLEGIEAETTLNNYNLVLHIVTDNRTDDLPKMVREKQVDGLILIGILHKELIGKILEKNQCTVLVDPKLNYERCSQVMIDNESGAYQITRYLINRGHKRIGFVSGNLERLSFRQRYEGYIKALQNYKIPIDERLIKSGGIENGYEFVKHLLLYEKPTAIFAANDINAIYGYKAIRELNLDIPGDISIVGFDDIDQAGFSIPPLTTVKVYKEELGSVAVRVLLKMIDSPGEIHTTTILPTVIVERESVKTIK